MRRLWVGGGAAGVASVGCYLLAILVPWPEGQLGTSTGLLVVSAFPILGVVFGRALSDALSEGRTGTAAQLGFAFAVAGYSVLLGMLTAQLAVGAGIGEVTRGLDPETAKALRRGLRLIDMGLDVAWDFLMGTAMVFWGAAMCGRSRFGLAWGVPTVALGVAAIGLNAATFPWPPGDHGLFDVGPVIAPFLAALGVRLILLGRRPAAALRGIRRDEGAAAG